MKIIEKFVDELSGREFKTREEAIKSEKKNGGIKKLFVFWNDKVDFDCDNSKCFQRKESDYIRLQEALVKAVNEYEPWIAEHYKKDGGFQKKHCGSGYIIGRFLSDGNSELYHWYCILSNTCSTCFREFNQPYGANHCTHSNKVSKL